MTNSMSGTEALNKALKYTYMPRNKRSMNLSSIVSLLMETFLPALRQKYLFANKAMRIAFTKITFPPIYITDQGKLFYTALTEKLLVRGLLRMTLK